MFSRNEIFEECWWLEYACHSIKKQENVWNIFLNLKRPVSLLTLFHSLCNTHIETKYIYLSLPFFFLSLSLPLTHTSTHHTPIHTHIIWDKYPTMRCCVSSYHTQRQILWMFLERKFEVCVHAKKSINLQMSLYQIISFPHFFRLSEFPSL